MSCHRIPKQVFKLSSKRKKKFGKTSETMEGFCFVIPVTGSNKPNVGKDDNDTDQR
jgi:hypothetical protein